MSILPVFVTRGFASCIDLRIAIWKFFVGRGWGFPVVSFVVITAVDATVGAYQSGEREAGTNYPDTGVRIKSFTGALNPFSVILVGIL